MSRPAAASTGWTGRVWHAVLTATVTASGAGIVLLMLPTVIDVSYRKAFGPSLPGIVEYSEVGLVVVVYLAMAAALRTKAHIATPILTSRLGARAAAFVRLAAQALMWVALGVMTYGSAGIALEATVSGEYRFGMIEVPVWPAKLAVPIGLLLLLVELTRQMLNETRVLHGPTGDHVA